MAFLFDEVAGEGGAYHSEFYLRGAQTDPGRDKVVKVVEILRKGRLLVERKLRHVLRPSRRKLKRWCFPRPTVVLASEISIR